MEGLTLRRVLLGPPPRVTWCRAEYLSEIKKMSSFV
jgi:hypothetical protein